MNKEFNTFTAFITVEKILLATSSAIIDSITIYYRSNNKDKIMKAKNWNRSSLTCIYHTHHNGIAS